MINNGQWGSIGFIFTNILLIRRSQQAAERWQARFEEKCREVKKYDTSLNFTKSALTRLEREKKILLAKLNEINSKGGKY